MTKRSLKKSDIDKKDIFVSVIVVSKTQLVDVAKYCRELSKELSGRYTNYEIIFIDNGIPREELSSLVELLDTLPCIRILRLSRVYSHDTAIIAGLESAIGDHVVITDPMLDPTKDIEGLVQMNVEKDIVQGVAKVSERRMLESNLGRKLFYWYNRRHLNIDIPIRATYFIALSRRAVRSITSSGRFESHIRHIIKTIGYSYAQYEYTTKEDPTKSRNLKTSVVEALDIVTSHSTHPLRFMSWIGFFASVLNLLYVFYILGIAIFKKDVVEGWTTMSLQLSVMFFILFLFMIVLAEYIGKILNEARQDARYLVMDELTSSLSLADAQRKNITN